jgi:ABC-type thiamine transport system substrate-binding protein
MTFEVTGVKVKVTKANNRFFGHTFTQHAQSHIAANNFEFPVSPEVKAPETVQSYAGFKAHPMSASAFARRQPEAQSVMSAVGWR